MIWNDLQKSGDALYVHEVDDEGWQYDGLNEPDECEVLVLLPAYFLLKRTL